MANSRSARPGGNRIPRWHVSVNSVAEAELLAENDSAYTVDPTAAELILRVLSGNTSRGHSYDRYVEIAPKLGGHVMMYPGRAREPTIIELPTPAIPSQLLTDNGLALLALTDLLAAHIPGAPVSASPYQLVQYMDPLNWTPFVRIPNDGTAASFGNMPGHAAWQQLADHPVILGPQS